MKLKGFSIEEILSSKDGGCHATSKHHDDIKDLPPHISYRPSDYHCRRYLPYPPQSRYAYRYYHHRSRSPTPAAISPDSSSNSDDLDGDKLSRRPRTSITVCQREFLEEEFQKERYPTLAYIDKLSRKVHLQQYVIKVWFQNRRAKYRKEGHRRKKINKEPTSNAEEKVPENETTSNEYFTERNIVDIESTDYRPELQIKYSKNNTNVKFHEKILYDRGSLHPSAAAPFLWQCRSKLDVSCRDGPYCRCLMCRENNKVNHY